MSEAESIAAGLQRIVAAQEQKLTALTAERDRLREERDALQKRLRVTAQIIIGCIGATGPENAETSADRIVFELQLSTAREATLRGLLARAVPMVKAGRFLSLAAEIESALEGKA